MNNKLKYIFSLLSLPISKYLDKIIIKSQNKNLTLNSQDGHHLVFQREINEEVINFKKPKVTLPHIPSDRYVYAPPTPLGQRPKLSVVSNAFVLGIHPIGFTHSGKIINDTIDFSNLDNRINTSISSCLSFSDKLMLLIKPFKKYRLRKSIQLKSAILLTSKWNHYGHWVPEHLLKLRSLIEFENKTGEKPLIIIGKNSPKWKYDMLNILGFSSERIYEWRNNLTKINRLVLPSYPEPNYEDFIWLKNKIISKIENFSNNNYPRIYLSRKNCSHLVVANENEYIPLLESRGFKIIRPEEFSILEQAEIFLNAKIIIGPHGSAFTNIFYSTHAHIVEFFGPRVPLAFYRLSLIMKHKYTPFFCSIDPKMANSRKKSSKIHVSSKELLSLVDNLLKVKE